MEKDIKELITRKLINKKLVTTNELKVILHKFNPNVSNSAYSWWISKLKNDGFITRLGRGVYTFNSKKDYIPNLTRKAKLFYNKTKQFLPDNIPLLMYENYPIADMLSVQRKNHYIFIHVPKEYLEMFFYDIIHLGKRVFIKPSKEVVERYITPFNEAVILYPFLSDMPLLDHNDYTTLSIEGILVHSIIFGAEYYRARAMDFKEVFKVALEDYNVNISKLMRYAARRERKKQVMAILSELDII